MLLDIASRDRKLSMRFSSVFQILIAYFPITVCTWYVLVHERLLVA